MNSLRSRDSMNIPIYDTNLITSVPSYETRHIFQSNFMTFESDMLQHSCLKVFQEFHIEPSQEETAKYLRYFKDERVQTIQDLLMLSYFQKQQLVGLIEAILRLDRICEEHLLTIKRVNFSPQAIFYDPMVDDFIWRYIPDKSYYSAYGPIDLIRHVLIESGVINHFLTLSEFSFDALTHQRFSFDTIHEWLQKNEPEKNEGRRPWKLFKTPKSMLVAENSPSITSHNAMYPILLNKLNPLESHKLYFDLNTVGRDECNNVFLNVASVSRKHAIVFKDGYQMKIKDLKSTNGTYVNGKRLMGEIAIENGDAIKLGEKEFIFIR